MHSLNQAQLIGNLTADPVMRSTQGGTSVCNFSVATNSSYKDKNGEWQQKVEYHNCIAWKGTADAICKIFKKGSKGYFSGSLQTSNWDDNGTKRYKTEIIVNSFVPLTPKEKTEGEQPYEENIEPIDFDF